MSLTQPFSDARAVLGVDATADPAALKRAYRQRVVESPPDRDPERFQQIRESYELLCDPLPRARELLHHPVPMVTPPPVPEVRAEGRVEPLPLTLLRAILGSLPAADFYVPEPIQARTAKRRSL